MTNNEQIQEIRKKLDAIDQMVLMLLRERFQLTKTVGEIKKQNNLPAVDPKREEAQMKRIQELAIEYGINPDLATSILRLIINEVVKNHKSL